MKLRWLPLALVLAISSCTDEGSSRKALEDEGYTNITFNGYDPFACSDEDSFSTLFVADSPNGKRVSGVVCCGITKACTIRH